MKQSEIIKRIAGSFKTGIELEGNEKKSYVKDLEFMYKGLILKEKIIQNASH